MIFFLTNHSHLWRSSGALSLGLFGNDQAHQALLVVQRSTGEMETVVKSVRNHTLIIEQLLDNSIREDVDQISVHFSGMRKNYVRLCFRSFSCVRSIF